MPGLVGVLPCRIQNLQDGSITEPLPVGLRVLGKDQRKGVPRGDQTEITDLFEF